MSNSDSYMTDSLGPDEIAQLESVTVLVAPDKRSDLRTLVGAWERHVDKIERDLDLPDSDRSVWGVHDLVAALSLRGFVQQGVDALANGLLEPARAALAAIDERFKSFTLEDPEGSIRMVDGRPALPEQWWWHRIPKRGPARRELDQIVRRIKSDE
jgi:hypothetical protein